MYKYELTPIFNHQKSFYRRAYVIADGNTKMLYSYDTPIIEYNCITDSFKKLWYGYSATTQKHIVEFCRQVSGKWNDSFNKKWFEAL